MTIPTPVPYSTIPVGGVFSTDLKQFWMSMGSGSAIDLASAGIVTTFPPAEAFFYFPSARLVIS